MAEWIKAGFGYFAGIFLLGFVLGTARVLLLMPYLGPFNAVLLETPVMLAASWYLCRYCLRRWPLPGHARSAALMGGLAFGLLMGAELLLSLLLMGNDFHQHLAHYRSPEGALGLTAQTLFGLFPLIQFTLLTRATAGQ